MDLIIFVVALSILVLVHEFGHFMAAKLTGVRVEEFGLGLPPRIIGKKWKGTVWSLNWLPIGGFCKLYGEDGEKKGSDAFNNKNPWQKALIVLGGVIMNVVLAVVIFTVVYSILGVPKTIDKVQVIEVAKNSPAASAGIKVNDYILSVDGVKVTTPEQLTEVVAKDKGKEADLMVENEKGQGNVLSVQVRANPPAGEGSMGVAISNTVMVKLKWYEFYKGVGAGFQEAYYWGRIIAGGVFQMIGGLLAGHPPKDVAGPIGIYQATSAIKQSQGMLAVIHFFGVVSVNLAIVNVLPFPALDGGRIVFVIYEILFKKKVNEKFEAVVNNIGMAVLLGLVLVITFGDISRLVMGH